MEGDLHALFWTYSFYELTKKIELKVGETTAGYLCHYVGLVQVVSAALGGDDKSKRPDVKKFEGQSLENAVADINNMLRLF